MMKIKVQKLREGTPQESYRIALPKSIMESKGWKDKIFNLVLKDNIIILIPLDK